MRFILFSDEEAFEPGRRVICFILFFWGGQMNMTKLYTTWMILADLRLKFPFVPSIGEWKEELKEGKYALIMFNNDIKKKKSNIRGIRLLVCFWFQMRASLALALMAFILVRVNCYPLWKCIKHSIAVAGPWYCISPFYDLIWHLRVSNQILLNLRIV